MHPALSDSETQMHLGVCDEEVDAPRIVRRRKSMHQGVSDAGNRCTWGCLTEEIDANRGV